MKILRFNVYIITICIMFEIANANTTLLFAYSDQICVSECKLIGKKFECRIAQYNRSIACSPTRGITTSGTKCRDGHECGLHGYGYYWCYTDYDNKWDFCGISLSIPESTYGIGKTYGIFCIDECSYRGYSYQWCKTTNGWDYCGYLNQYLTRYGDRCLSDCKKYRNYYYCDIASESTRDWDYCSKDISSTIRGKQCRDDHQCNKYGYKYYWCYTDNDNHWDYCSPQYRNNTKL